MNSFEIGSPSFKIGFGSCNRQYISQNFWDSIGSRLVFHNKNEIKKRRKTGLKSAFIFTGDAVYPYGKKHGHSTSVDSLIEAYQLLNNNTYYSKFSKNTSGLVVTGVYLFIY